MSLEDIYAPVKQELQNVEERLKAVVASEVYPVCDLYNYVLSSGGKRIRPVLVLLSAKSLNYESSGVIDIACAVELIHMASLIHDDVIDSAKLRRGRPAAHTIWGTEVAVTMGDYLFSQAMELLAKYEDHEVINIFSKSVKCMAEGELLQTVSRGDAEHTEEKYIRIVSGKTASLMSASCESVARVASAPDTYYTALTQYGLDFGVSYQIADDVLDLVSTDSQLGKPVMNSIKEGNITLPMIHALKNCNGRFKEQLLSVLFSEQIDYAEMLGIIESITRSGSLSYTQDIARMYANKAKKSLAVLGDSAAKQGLMSFADFIVNGHLARSSRQPAEAGIL